MSIDAYDSEIVADLSGDSRTMVGEWTRRAPKQRVRLGFVARRGDAARFLAEPAVRGEPGAELVTNVGGAWVVTFRDGEGEETARGEFAQDGTRVIGTFLTPAGDYRFLEGDYAHGRLRLSCFDGAHAFLFIALARPDGTLAGDFWSRDSFHATWTARRAANAHEGLPDAYALAAAKSPDGRIAFTFPDVEGRLVSLSDARYRGKAVLVNVFGSWCPNCNDEAPLLAAWYRRYRAEGLEVIGLAYEMTGEASLDRDMVRRYAARHGIEYPLLLAGTSSRKSASESLPDVTAIAAFPTTIFLGRDGRIRKIHSGFAGPGTGEHHRRLVAEMETLIRSLVGAQN